MSEAPFSLKGMQEQDELERQERARIRKEILFEEAAENVPKLREEVKELQKRLDRLGATLTIQLTLALVFLALILWRLW